MNLKNSLKKMDSGWILWWMGGLLLFSSFVLQSFTNGFTLGMSQASLTQPDFGMPLSFEITVFNNDSVSNFTIKSPRPMADLSDTLSPIFTFDISPRYFGCVRTVSDTLLYTQRWDTLPQTKFWQMVMGMRRDSCIVNVSSTRKIVEVKPSYWWETLSETSQEQYKDSIRTSMGLAANEGIYITAGKRHYYAFDKVLPSISEGVSVFDDKGVDPWYAQAILLIESPGKLQYSPVGAYGSFQLMEDVAKEHGLVVNDSIDEREDFAKAAGAAADLISTRCIPQTRRMLRKRGIEFEERQLWFRLLVLHSYHAGAGNVDGVLEAINPSEGGQELMKRVWTTEYKGFKNASQNYSQVALASILQLDEILAALPDTVCRDSIIIM